MAQKIEVVIEADSAKLAQMMYRTDRRTMIQKNPNAAASVGFGGLGILIAWGAGQLGYDLAPEAAVAIAGALTTIGLFIGRRGIRGLVRLVWRGNQKDAA